MFSHRRAILGSAVGISFVSRPDIESLREGMFAEGVEGASPVYVTLTGGQVPEQVRAALVTDGLIRLPRGEVAAGARRTLFARGVRRTRRFLEP